MKIVTWNVNGLRAVARKGLFSWLQAEQPDILCMQETKAHRGQLPPELAEPEEYEAYFHSAKKKGYSGVSTWIRKDGAAKLTSEPVTALGVERFDDEGRVLVTEFEGFALINCYFPHSQRELGRLDYKLDFYDTFLHHCNRLRREGKRVIITGDLNTAHHEIDLARPKENRQNSGFLQVERDRLDQFEAHGYIDAFRLFHEGPGHYTWWSYLFGAREANVGWRIDYFFVSDDLVAEVKDCHIQPEIEGSDHCPVVLELTAAPNQQHP